MDSIKKRSLKVLSNGINAFEESRNAVRNSDFTDIKTFVKDYLNTSEPKQRRKLAEEFKKRHLELYEFLKENSALISAETDMSRIIEAAVNGEEQSADNKQITNLLEAIGGSMNDIQ